MLGARLRLNDTDKQWLSELNSKPTEVCSHNNSITLAFNVCLIDRTPLKHKRVWASSHWNINAATQEISRKDHTDVQMGVAEIENCRQFLKFNATATFGPWDASLKTYEIVRLIFDFQFRVQPMIRCVKSRQMRRVTENGELHKYVWWSQNQMTMLFIVIQQILQTLAHTAGLLSHQAFRANKSK